MCRWAVGRNAGHQLLLSYALAAMVVNDLDMLGAPARPMEADPVALIDADAVLAAPVPSEALEAIARRSS